MRAILNSWMEREALRAMPVTLAVASAGGAAAALAHLPAPWLSGAAVATTIAALCGAKLGLPRAVREIALVFLGVSMGATMTPDTLALMLRFPLGLAGLLVAVPLVMIAVSTYLQRVHGFDGASARLAAVPGVLPYVLAMAAETRGDTSRVMIVQIFRLVAIAALLPSAVTVLGGAGHAAGTDALVGRSLHGGELLLALTAGLIGWLIFARLGMPAPSLFGSMVAGAACFGSGLIATSFPAWLVVPGNVVIGAMTAASFSGADTTVLRRTVPAAAGALAVGSLTSLACAWPVAAIAGLPIAQVWLAYAPGAVETMAVVTMALGYDAAFVGAHHIARFFGLMMAVPLWIRPYLGGDEGSSRDRLKT